MFALLAGFGSSDDDAPDRPPLTLKLSHSHGPSRKHSRYSLFSLKKHQIFSFFVQKTNKTLILFLLPVDDGSDWSTLTAESGEDTFWPVATETEDCEVVRCVCEVDEENDFMIQVTTRTVHKKSSSGFNFHKSCVKTLTNF